jgi:thiamine-phosphate pyrophosphorylase
VWSVNDRADLAVAAGTDVLHLGQDDLPVAIARSIVGGDVVLGASTHAEHEVAAAIADDDVDYFCVGPTWPTPTKPGRPAPGLPLLAHAAAASSVKPWFAIGGIDLTTIDAVLAAGATRVVVVRAITEADDPQASAAALRDRLP